jgi:DNA-binding NarL/FixJ family response regulator
MEFVFCEKETGIAQFRIVETNLDRVAAIFAIQCFTRGSDPQDFTILVPAAAETIQQLTSLASDIIARGLGPKIPLVSPRQKQILQLLIQSKCNKEIAMDLRITVRTVKFHISLLLERYHAIDRYELARRAPGILGLNILKSTGP